MTENKACFTNKNALEGFKRDAKKIKTIIDDAIKNDLLKKAEELSDENWILALQNYYHPLKKTKVRRGLTVVSEGSLEVDSNGRERIGEFCGFGGKETKGHKGQILYFSDKGSVKVMPVYTKQKYK